MSTRPQDTEAGRRDGEAGAWTPGPWNVEGPDHLIATISVFGGCADDREWTICDMGVPIDLCCSAREDMHPRLIAEQEANARLIAAAPDLYDALVEARARLCGLGVPSSAHSVCDLALAKASGQ